MQRNNPEQSLQETLFIIKGGHHWRSRYFKPSSEAEFFTDAELHLTRFLNQQMIDSDAALLAWLVVQPSAAIQ